jgi:hypothetical protein
MVNDRPMVINSGVCGRGIKQFLYRPLAYKNILHSKMLNVDLRNKKGIGRRY